MSKEAAKMEWQKEKQTINKSLQPLACISVAIYERKSYNGCTRVLALSGNVYWVHFLCQNKFNDSRINPLVVALLASVNLHWIAPTGELTKTYKIIKKYFFINFLSDHSEKEIN